MFRGIVRVLIGAGVAFAAARAWGAVQASEQVTGRPEIKASFVRYADPSGRDSMAVYCGKDASHCRIRWVASGEVMRDATVASEAVKAVLDRFAGAVESKPSSIETDESGAPGQFRWRVSEGDRAWSGSQERDGEPVPAEVYDLEGRLARLAGRQ